MDWRGEGCCGGQINLRRHNLELLVPTYCNAECIVVRHLIDVESMVLRIMHRTAVGRFQEDQDTTLQVAYTLYLHVLEVTNDLALRPNHQAALVCDELALEPPVHPEKPGEL